MAELFGPTFQGEGPSLGTRAAFLRLSRCNLACSGRMPCDTPYTWDTTRYDLRRESSRRSVTEVGDELLLLDTALVVITGGEPLIQQQQLVPLVLRLVDANRRVEFETNGTFGPLPELLIDGVRFNVSPKLSNAGMAESMRIVPEALTALVGSGKAVFKFVATERSDLDEIDDLVQRYGLSPVYVMPEGRTPDAVITRARELADDVIARGWSMTQRLHVLLWGDERGR
ncbi:7-carboxy-7-deazaguanine synthase QueE [Streptosporangium sp. NBC_01755]|uniref:7-carboxy-7-deazaguanine synthase QueE n=1 Tax=unclassified Streptosporangium TaxID=2632669 RepID=UPI002DD8786B|nr:MULTISPECIES: 7-carboxy-7-deazaguanine synthase QueE [unclassified Streptosporangium]WSA29790.1 7-carboxy-7-deazaguanine synthase QueE [Streptosporangium sp. NBC_01810]WSD04075.1 7-carboxy-7-deazaguanine synthase QueE [Streptosporangium sp. NBC_01755]